MNDSLADDRPEVSKGWVASFGLLFLGVNVAWAAPSQLLIANQILGWHPENKEALLALIMAIGGGLSVVATPLWGLLSDRTRSRFGRRVPWIVVGAVGAAASLVGLGLSPSFGVLVLLWGIFQILIAAAITTSQAIPPDRVSRRQYGMVSGVMGVAYTMAIVVGTLLAESLSILTAYVASAVLVVALVLPFLVGHRATTVLPTPPPQRTTIDAEANRPRRFSEYKDFTWVFISRLSATLGNTVALFYLLYYLRDYIGLDDPDGGVLMLTVIYAVVVVAAAMASGHFSDKIARRKPFVVVGCSGVAVACLLMAFADGFGTVIVAAVVLGASWGTFTAIDQALINQVLPHREHRGRDVGLMHLAVLTPNLLSPLLAAFALLVLGGYPGLYLTAAGLAVVGAITVTRVKSSR